MDRGNAQMRTKYAHSILTIAAATLVMVGMMYLNTYALDHLWFSQTWAWMDAGMAIIMLASTRKIYPSRKAHSAIVAGALVLFALSLRVVRSQKTVDDVSCMKAMIPHHSITIMTSRRVHIRDPHARKLADGIIDAQVREIGEMEQLIAELKQHPPADDAPDLAVAAGGSA